MFLLALAMSFNYWHREKFLHEQNGHHESYGEKSQRAVLIPLGQCIKLQEMLDVIFFPGNTTVLQFLSQFCKWKLMIFLFYYVVHSFCCHVWFIELCSYFVLRILINFIELQLCCRVEAESLRHFSAKYCPLLPPPRSTIAAAFSPDGKTLASTQWVTCSCIFFSF